MKPAGGSGFFYDQRCDDSSLLTVLIVVHLDDCPLGAAGQRYPIAFADVVVSIKRYWKSVMKLDQAS
ncbi:MAG: hypothetical protein DMF98_13925 [Acidobacteria bacterium]|nr:MAG: hypothetical protein DMF98_13925 [Acidobacteriota bacterium]